MASQSALREFLKNAESTSSFLETLGLGNKATHQAFLTHHGEAWKLHAREEVIPALLEMSDTFHAVSPISETWRESMQSPFAHHFPAICNGCFEGFSNLSDPIHKEIRSQDYWAVFKMKIERAKEQLKALHLTAVQADALLSQLFVKHFLSSLDNINMPPSSRSMWPKIKEFTLHLDTLRRTDRRAQMESSFSSNGILLEMSVGTVGRLLMKGVCDEVILKDRADFLNVLDTKPSGYLRGESLLNWATGILEGLSRQWDYEEETPIDPLTLQKIKALMNFVAVFDRAQAKADATAVARSSEFKPLTAWVEKKELEYSVERVENREQSVTTETLLPTKPSVLRQRVSPRGSILAQASPVSIESELASNVCPVALRPRV